MIGRGRCITGGYLNVAADEGGCRQVVQDRKTKIEYGDHSLPNGPTEVLMPNNYLPPLRRVAEAVSARLCYDYLCFKGDLMDEGYLNHIVADVLGSFYDPSKVVIRKGVRHPVLGAISKKSGRKSEVDFSVVERGTNVASLVIEAKWAGSSYCTPTRLLWDLVRLKLIKNAFNNCVCGLLIAGHKSAMEKLFNRPLLKLYTQHPLHRDGARRKHFLLTGNQHHQELINKFKAATLARIPGLIIPDTITTRLSTATYSAHDKARFVARCWRVE